MKVPDEKLIDFGSLVLWMTRIGFQVTCNPDKHANPSADLRLISKYHNRREQFLKTLKKTVKNFNKLLDTFLEPQITEIAHRFYHKIEQIYAEQKQGIIDFDKSKSKIYQLISETEQLLPLGYKLHDECIRNSSSVKGLKHNQDGIFLTNEQISLGAGETGSNASAAQSTHLLFGRGYGRKSLNEFSKKYDEGKTIFPDQNAKTQESVELFRYMMTSCFGLDESHIEKLEKEFIDQYKISH